MTKLIPTHETEPLFLCNPIKLATYSYNGVEKYTCSFQDSRITFTYKHPVEVESQFSTASHVLLSVPPTGHNSMESHMGRLKILFFLYSKCVLKRKV